MSTVIQLQRWMDVAVGTLEEDLVRFC